MYYIGKQGNYYEDQARSQTKTNELTQLSLKAGFTGKADAQLAVKFGQELKLVYPQPGVDPARFISLAFDNYYLQPMDGPDRVANMIKAIEYCQQHPQWSLSVQTHKMIGIR